METNINRNIEPRPPWFEGNFFKTCSAVMPIIRWVIVLGMFIFGGYIYQRDVNAQNNVSVVDVKREQEAIKKMIDERGAYRDKELDEIKKAMLTREVFDAYHKSDSERSDRIEKMIQQMLERQSN